MSSRLDCAPAMLVICDVARRHGLSSKALRGGRRCDRAFAEARDEAIRCLLLDGFTDAQIADAMGLAESTVAARRTARKASTAAAEKRAGTAHPAVAGVSAWDLLVAVAEAAGCAPLSIEEVLDQVRALRRARDERR